MTLPACLYKYESFSAQSLQNLKNQVIYFGSPRNFNDPYDCALSPSIKSITENDLERLKLCLSSNFELESRIRNEYGNNYMDSLHEIFSKEKDQILNTLTSGFLQKRGVSCFSEKEDSLLMWSHYGGHGKGFCLEFSTSNEMFQKVRKVRYENKIPEIDIVAMFCNEDYDTIINNLYCTKGTDWGYEEEWRVIHSEVGTEYGYPPSALTGVYFGPDMQDAAIEIIISILAGQNERVKLWKGSRSKVSFSVKFQPITYISHFEPKRKAILLKKFSSK